MRYLLFLLSLVVPVCVTAQEATWVSTDGPGYADLTTFVLDGEGQPLLETASGTLVFSEGVWTSYTDVRPVLAVIDADYLVAAENAIYGGTGQNPFNEYESFVRIWHRVSGSDEALGGFAYTGGSQGGFAERALVAPDGDVWVGFQHYFGLDGDLGDDDGVGVARLASEDVTANPDDWTMADLPDAAESLNALGWSPALGLLVATDDGVYARFDDVWSRLGLEGEPVSAVVSTDNGTLLAASSTTVYRSGDAGATWTPAATLPGAVNDLLVTDDAVLAAVSSAGVFRSTDTGLSWAQTDLTASASDLAGALSGPYYAVAEGATLFFSEDGLAWAAERFVNTNVSSLTLTTSGIIAQSGDLHRYSDGDWQRLPFDAPRLFISSFAASPTTGAYFAAVPYDRQDEEPGDLLSRLYRSGDEGATWQSIRAFTGSTTDLFVTNQASVLACYFRVVERCSIERSTDDGETWTVAFTDGSPFTFAQGPSGTLYTTPASLEFDGGFDVSTDDGQTWSEAGIVPTEYPALLETPDGTLVAGGCDGVFHSDDGGATWTASDLTLPTAALVQNTAGDLFAGLRRCFGDQPLTTGVYRSTDDGQTWQPYGLDERPVLSLALDAEGVLFAGTDRGVFRTVQTTVEAEDGATPSTAMAVYPNPVAHSATLRFATASAGRVTVTVFDVLGRTVATLHDADITPGLSRSPVVTAGQASGMYFVRVVTPSEARTLPVTVVR